jgi:hypothetical protein
MRDFACCGQTLLTLHDLLQHYEEAHAQQTPTISPACSSVITINQALLRLRMSWSGVCRPLWQFWAFPVTNPQYGTYHEPSIVQLEMFDFRQG